MRTVTTVPERLERAAAVARRFVEARLGEPLPPICIAVATRFQLARCAARTAAAVVGGRAPRLGQFLYGLCMWREARTGLACTLLAPAGVLVIVTRQAVGDPRLTDYLVHEFVHAVQAHRPGRREQMTERLRFDLGMAHLDEARQYGEFLRHEAEEGEAYRIQAEHAGLSPLIPTRRSA
ncbi:hypothetical protein [Streptomyces sp. RPT161]|uniref:hypothetical protein n=1 Tax=Streptomyces sp. RPT161 TaxID=3015993 RepID=UPI0022B90187|nr:hypothetical protein [Streptomyces sp. RPT161]